MQIAINFQNEAIAQKVLWVLERFKDDGVEVVKIDDDDQDIIENFKDGLQEIKLIKGTKLNSKPIEELLSEL